MPGLRRNDRGEPLSHGFRPPMRTMLSFQGQDRIDQQLWPLGSKWNCRTNLRERAIRTGLGAPPGLLWNLASWPCKDPDWANSQSLWRCTPLLSALLDETTFPCHPKLR